MCLRRTCWMNDFLRSPFTYQSEIEEDESFCQDYINMDIVYRRNRDYDWISEFWRWGPVTQNNCVYLCLLDPQYNKENFRVRSPRIGWARHGDGGGREIRGMLLKKYREIMLYLCEMASQNMICFHESSWNMEENSPKLVKTVHPNLFHWYLKGQMTLSE